MTIMHATIQTPLELLYGIMRYKTIHSQGRTCKEFIGGCWTLGTDFLQK